MTVQSPEERVAEIKARAEAATRPGNGPSTPDEILWLLSDRERLEAERDARAEDARLYNEGVGQAVRERNAAEVRAAEAEAEILVLRQQRHDNLQAIAARDAEVAALHAVIAAVRAVAQRRDLGGWAVENDTNRVDQILVFTAAVPADVLTSRDAATAAKTLEEAAADEQTGWALRRWLNARAAAYRAGADQ